MCVFLVYVCSVFIVYVCIHHICIRKDKSGSEAVFWFLLRRNLEVASFRWWGFVSSVTMIMLLKILIMSDKAALTSIITIVRNFLLHAAPTSRWASEWESSRRSCLRGMFRWSWWSWWYGKASKGARDASNGQYLSATKRLQITPHYGFFAHLHQCRDAEWKILTRPINNNYYSWALPHLCPGVQWL